MISISLVTIYRLLRRWRVGFARNSTFISWLHHDESNNVYGMMRSSACWILTNVNKYLVDASVLIDVLLPERVLFFAQKSPKIWLGIRLYISTKRTSTYWNIGSTQMLAISMSMSQRVLPFVFIYIYISTSDSSLTNTSLLWISRETMRLCAAGGWIGAGLRSIDL